MPLQIIAQPESLIDSSLTQAQFIKGCAAYRGIVIDGIVDVLVRFNLFCDKLKSLSENQHEHEAFRQAMMKIFMVNAFADSDSKYIYQPSDFKGVNIEPEYFQAYLDWFRLNSDLIAEYGALTGYNVIEKSYPFKLLPEPSLWDEMDFYRIEHGQTLIDLGAGTGYFSFILALSDIDTRIIMTELDTSFVKYLRGKLLRLESNEIKQSMQVVEGQSKHTGLNRVKADRIFLRNVFHHFDYPQEMLNSIRQNLKEDGLVCVNERVKDYDTDKKDSCKKMIRRSKIISGFEKAGFKLEAEMKLNEAVLLLFSTH